MKTEFIAQTFRDGRSVVIAIPHPIRNFLNIRNGDFVKISIKKVRKNVRKRTA